MTIHIPERLQRNRYWRGLLYIFLNCEKLKPLLNDKYVNPLDERVNISGLKKLSAPWSESEKFMLNLALHLYNEKNRVNLSDMDYLDADNFEIAITAIRLRYAKSNGD